MNEGDLVWVTRAVRNGACPDSYLPARYVGSAKASKWEKRARVRMMIPGYQPVITVSETTLKYRERKGKRGI